ncbi:MULTISPECIES: hypothetical protein [Chryseobacterium]|jgi:hypothetical protein|uniref:Uncharacterized protein n=1 Tax=Chryseobacterium rhizosphaerae TaxID=395937 RepID=A0AAE3Y7F9_9FLAO|nr:MULTISPECIES: hypothetical protein [Chryseobacterium]MBL3548512.1 hypothetical protein [Chryseobacterium sp. KMC2]MDC8102791.1 hypothetical protein [Chryseobacterium rhizosphaerae]MDR6526404.1 hypothetical protein [Chryseobacterium rhizosphaerae]MDR6545973.1 hypothetical protein [Chryseobacterium rhizosphaerae]REC77671.1 hypothetical protein DRF57_03100 [Chryseobacterium rhizosphaerae]
MRNFVFGILVMAFALLSCKSDDESLQRIDQIMNIYMVNSAGQDLLNSKKPGSFSGYSVNDSLGDRDISPVNIPLRMRADSTFYMEYIAGAKRKRLDSVSPDNPGTGNSYYSVMTLGLRRTVNNVADTITDRLRIEYRKTPTLFQVSKVYYNDVLQFSKEADQPNSINTFTITK